MDNANNEAETVPVNRGRIDSVTVYDVKEEELQALEEGGSRAKWQSQVCTLFVSVVITSLMTLMATKDFKYDWAQSVFVCLIIVGLLLGGYLFFDLKKTQKSNSQIADKIRSRVKKKT